MLRWPMGINDETRMTNDDEVSAQDEIMRFGLRVNGENRPRPSSSSSIRNRFAPRTRTKDEDEDDTSLTVARLSFWAGMARRFFGWDPFASYLAP
jgi:hypothetical protein